MFDLFANILAKTYSIVPNYVLSIAVLTILVRLVLLPLTAKQTRSMQAMQTLQPELKKLQTKYKDDRQKLNEEMMALYKEHNVNPLSGCLPLLIQMPVFIIMYRVVHGLLHQPEPRYLDKSSELFRDLVASGGKMVSFGMDFSQKASSVEGGLLKALPFYLLVAAVMLTGFLQQQQMTKRAVAKGQPVNQQMQIMGRVFPLFFGLISWTLPAAMVVYFLVSNLWQMGQQAYLLRQTDSPPKSQSKQSKSPTPSPKGPGRFAGLLRGDSSTASSAAVEPPPHNSSQKGHKNPNTSKKKKKK